MSRIHHANLRIVQFVLRTNIKTPSWVLAHGPPNLLRHSSDRLQSTKDPLDEIFESSLVGSVGSISSSGSWVCAITGGGSCL